MNSSPRRLSPNVAIRALTSPSLEAAIAAVLVLGLLSAIGVWMPGSGFSRPFGSLPSATLGGTLGCAAIAIALWGRKVGKRWLLRAGGALALLVGLVPLLARALATESIPASSIATRILREVPLTTGLLLLIGGLGLLALSVRYARPLGYTMAGVFGSTSLVLSLTVIAGRVFGFLTGSDGSLLMGASPYALLACAVNGAVLMRLAASSNAPTWPVASWLPNAIGISAAATVIFVWLALVDRDQEQLQSQVELASVLATGSVRSELVRVVNGIERLTLRVAVRTPEIDAALAEQMQLLVKDETQPIRAVAWPRAGHAPTAQSTILVAADSLGAATLPGVIERGSQNPASGEGSAGQPIEFFNTPNDREDFGIGVRDCAKKGCRSPFAVLVDARRIFSTLLADSLTGFYLAVRLDSQYVAWSQQKPRPDDKWRRSTYLNLPAAGSRWEVTVWPTAATLARAESDLPEGVLVLGLMLAMLLPVTLRLAGTTWSTAARAERARVNTAMESATDSLWVWDIANDTIERGRALWSRLGYPSTRGAVPVNDWLALVHPKEKDALRAAMARYLSNDTDAVEVSYRVRDSEDRWHWLVERGRLVERSEDGSPLRAIGVTADITDRKNADDALAASERKYRATFDSASQMKALLDDRACIVEMNPAGRMLSGDAESAIGRPIWDFPAFHGSQTMRSALTEACERGYAGRGTAFVVQLEIDEVDSPTWDLSVTPIASGDGTVTQLLVNARDITDRKRAEQALRELGNLATMGRLTALVAHEINNPLAGIHSAFSLIKSAVPESHPHFKYVGAIEREISRIAQVTKQLYETYRHEPESSRGASVETVVSDAVAFIEQVNRRSSVRIAVDLAAASTVVPFPDALIRRVVYNLVQNAVEASPEGGTVYLTASSSDYVFTLTVRDEGCGIPPDVRGRIFDPFFSTKGSGIRTGGMGLGLALVHGSVTAFGGTVSVQDAPAGGSLFTVRLPLSHTLDGVPAYGTRANTVS